MTFDPFSALTPAEISSLAAGLTITAVRIAMPVMAALFLVDLGMGLVARTVPQVQILFVAMPIKVVVGMVVLMAALPATGQILNVVIGNTLAGSSLRLLEAG